MFVHNVTEASIDQSDDRWTSLHFITEKGTGIEVILHHKGHQPLTASGDEMAPVVGFKPSDVSVSFHNLETLDIRRSDVASGWKVSWYGSDGAGSLTAFYAK